jgi:NADPH-dependent ferric siderophore reductase
MAPLTLCNLVFVIANPNDTASPDRGGADRSGTGDSGGSDLGTSALLTRLPEALLWELTVSGSTVLTPSMRRISFAAPNLSDLRYEPGQDLMFAIPGSDGRTFRRRYTIRQLEVPGGRLDVDFVLHGDGPGARWAEGTKPGDTVEAIGPRGKVLVDRAAGWHLFLGDESALPVTAAMIESLDSGSRAVALVEVDGPDDEQAISAPAGVEVDVHWLHRGRTAAGKSTVLADELAALALPDGRGHAYVNGEMKTVNGLRAALVQRGMDPATVSAKPYWRHGVANAAHGEPGRD